MALQTSEQAGANGISEIERITGVKRKRPGQCEKHGNFIEPNYARSGVDYWAGCPSCGEEKRQERDRLDQIEAAESRRQGRIDKLLRDSGVPIRYLSKSFDDYAPINAQAASHLAKLREYASLVASEDHEGRCLILTGKVGTGKTHLACALTTGLIREHGKRVVYWSFSDLVRSVKATFNRDSAQREEDIYSRIAQQDLVIIDEVGQQNFTEFEQTVAYEAINARYQDALPTVLVTNLAAADLAGAVGDRAVDRLRENGGKLLDFQWQSHRGIK